MTFMTIIGTDETFGVGGPPQRWEAPLSRGYWWEWPMASCYLYMGYSRGVCVWI